MTKAEERAFEAFPEIKVSSLFSSHTDANRINRDRFMEGYRRAEKDCELTVRDVEKIVGIYLETKNPFLPHEDTMLNVLWDFRRWKEKDDAGQGKVKKPRPKDILKKLKWWVKKFFRKVVPTGK